MLTNDIVSFEQLGPDAQTDICLLSLQHEKMYLREYMPSKSIPCAHYISRLLPVHGKVSNQSMWMYSLI